VAAYWQSKDIIETASGCCSSVFTIDLEPRRIIERQKAPFERGAHIGLTRAI
jgi:hypothetical protein